MREDNGGLSVKYFPEYSHENIRKIFGKILHTNIVSSVTAPYLICSAGVFFSDVNLERNAGWASQAKDDKIWKT